MINMGYCQDPPYWSGIASSDVIASDDATQLVNEQELETDRAKLQLTLLIIPISSVVQQDMNFLREFRLTCKFLPTMLTGCLKEKEEPEKSTC